MNQPPHHQPPHHQAPHHQPRPAVILQAHATRSLAAQALLLHGRDRAPRDLRKPFGPLIASLVIAVVLVLAVAIGARVGELLGQH